VAEDDPASEPANPKALIKTSMGDITVELLVKSAPQTVANFLGLAGGTKEWKDPTSGEMVKRPFYDGLTFHRVIPDFMIQGGCPLGNGSGGPGYKFEDEINAKSYGLDKLMILADEKPNPEALSRLMIRTQTDFQRVVMRPLFAKLGITSQEQLEAKRAEVQKAVDALSVMDVWAMSGYKYDDTLKSFPNAPGYLSMANSGPNTNGSQFFINLGDNSWLNGKHTVFGKVLTGLDIAQKIVAVPVDPRSARPTTPVTIISIRKIGAE
jgi:cyclophilin family peptidyl-prolyl cis-trans isomerase